MAEIDHCMYFVKRKKRYCRMSVKKGNKYCGEHQHSTEIISAGLEENKRVKCPLDPTHTCYQSKLSKHLVVCNAKRLEDAQPKFIEKGINKAEETFEVPRHVPLSEINQSLVDRVINKVHSAYADLPEIPEENLQHKILEDTINDPSCGRAAKKHLLQNTSLLAHLERAGLTQDDTCFIEFGAGKGKLTYWLGQTIRDKKDSCILLVDRSSHRHKSDNKLRNEQLPLMIKRVRADIADLKLNEIQDIRRFANKVAVAKHLCGSATDLTLNCLVRAMQNEPKCNVNGLVIAFCCHHRCEYSLYVGKEYLKERGFMPEEFPILCSLASWATCGTGLSRMNKIQKEDETLRKFEREEIGRRVKTLLNWGRTEYLKTIGFQCDLLYYTRPDVSLENMCMIARRTAS